MGMDPGVHRRRRAARAYTFHTQQSAPPPSARNVLLQFLPLILIVLFSALMNWSNSPVFSLNQSSSFPMRLITTRLNAPFYVNSRFQELSNSEKNNVISRVESEYFDAVHSKCVNEAYSRRYMGQGDPMSGPYCREFDRAKRALGMTN